MVRSSIEKSLRFRHAASVASRCLFISFLFYTVALGSAQGAQAGGEGTTEARVGRLIGDIVSGQERALGELALMGAPAVRPLLKTLRQGSTAETAAAARALVRLSESIQGNATILSHIRQLEAADGFDRSIAASNLVKVGDEAVPYLLISAKDPRLATMVAEILKRIGVPDPKLLTGDPAGSTALSMEWKISAEGLAVERRLSASGDSLYALAGVLVKYDTDGTELWRTSYGIPGNPTTMTTDQDGFIYVVAEQEEDWIITKYSPDGHISWSTRYRPRQSESPLDGPRSIAVDNVGNVYVVGLFSHSQLSSNLAILSYDAIGGDLGTAVASDVFVKGPLGDTQRLSPSSLAAVAVDRLGNVYAALGEYSRGKRFAKWTSKGKLDWSIAFEEEFTPKAIEIDDAGNLYAAGAVGDRDAGIKIVRISPEAQLLQFADLTNELTGLGTMTSDIDGGLIIAMSGYKESVIVKLCSDGSIAWRHRARSADDGAAIPSGLALDDRGHVFLSTWSEAVLPGPEFTVSTGAIVKYGFQGDLASACLDRN